MGPHPIRPIAVVGGECSGKSTLAAGLAQTLPAVYVPEVLRAFVDRHSRVPRKDEQIDVLEQQVAAEREAAVTATAADIGYVVSDAGPLMTAVYSQVYYADDSLIARARSDQRHYFLTVWCDIDIEWRADGGQRDGPQYRSRVHEALGAMLADSGSPFISVSGPVKVRLDAVLELIKSAIPAGESE